MVVDIEYNSRKNFERVVIDNVVMVQTIGTQLVVLAKETGFVTEYTTIKRIEMCYVDRYTVKNI